MSDMFLPDPPDPMVGYEPTERDDELALEAIEMLSAAAEEAVAEGTYGARCIAGEAVYFYNYTRGLKAGHIYSHLGMDEFKISGSCEYHFDLWTKEPDEE